MKIEITDADRIKELAAETARQLETIRAQRIKIAALQKQMQRRCGSADIEYCKIYCDYYDICGREE